MIGAAKLNLLRNHVTGDSAATTSLRQYVAGTVPVGLFPPELNGQTELLKANSPKPDLIVMK